MRVFLTGATGYIGSAVADALQSAGHDVTGLARSDKAEQQLRSRGIRVWRGTLENAKELAAPAGNADGVIHTALSNDAGAGLYDTAAVEAMLRALDGTGKPFIYTSGVWVMGNTGTSKADETSALHPIPLVAWRVPVERSVLAAANSGVRTIVIRPAMVYGRDGGVIARMIESTHHTGATQMIGTGGNRWTFVHVDDLADLYVRALQHAPPEALLIGASGPAIRVRDLAEIVSRAAGASGRVASIEPEEAFKVLGPYAQGLALDQQVSGKTAEQLLGWKPRHASVLEYLAGHPSASPVSVKQRTTRP